MADSTAFTIVTAPAILSYPSLFVPRPKHPKTPDVKTYQAVMLMPASFDVGPLRKCMDATRTLMERKGVMAPAKRIKENMSVNGNPLHKAEDRMKVDENGKKILPAGYEAGGHYITLHSKDRPILVDEQVQAVIDEAKFYPGCWCIFHLGCFVWDGEGKWGLSFGLNGVQFVKDGDRLGGGRPDITNQFAPITGAGKVVVGKVTAMGAAAEDPFA